MVTSRYLLDEGTLSNRHGYDKDLVDFLLQRVSLDNPELVKSMKLGVAYHHSGINNKGRVAIEALFRNRFVQVVFSTATLGEEKRKMKRFFYFFLNLLALEIHMPTKSVAFVQDSIYLDALQYRQASGRTGRRGFDIERHVIFIDIPLRKIQHLIMSSIPNIQSHFPSSVTFFLRLLNLCSNAKDTKNAINRCSHLIFFVD
jgi:ATP-dependent RNA helicase DDX60